MALGTADGVVHISVDDGAVVAYLRRLQRRVSDLTPAMRAIGAELESAISDRFETETDPEGRRWEEWAPSYARAYPDDANGRILDRYSDMLDSVSWDADADSVAVGFGVDYAVYHEFGTVRMPRRGLLTADPETGELSDADSTRILEVLTDFLGDA